MSGNNFRVAITGMGAICGLGNSLKEIWPNLIEGKSGISLVENSNMEQLNTKIAGEVKNFTLDEDLLDPKEAKRFDNFAKYAIQATKEALNNAHYSNNYEPSEVGSILGVGMGGFPVIETEHQNFLEKGQRRVSPFFIPTIIPNMATGLITMKFGFKGINYTVASACASATHAISAACYEIASGRQKMMITGGTESVICNTPIAGFQSMKALSKRNEEPTKASRPFDKDRDGFVMGEGTGILVLENYEEAKKRGAPIFAEIIGHGASSDAHHITAPHPEGLGAIQCMKMALKQAGIDPSKIDYINAHGTSTPLGDVAEVKAIHEVFGDHANNLLVSSTKSMTGHLLGAAGGIETIFCAMALHTGEIPPTINVENQDEECNINCVPNKAIKKNIEYALNNSFGFGGTNATTILKKA